MNFEKWYESISGEEDAFCYYTDAKDIAKTTWDACKKEILKILYKRNNTNIMSTFQMNQFSDEINEIEKL